MSTFAYDARIQIARAFVHARNLLSRLRSSMIETRRQRAIVEADLFRGRYRLSSKNDDDLPIVRRRTTTRRRRVMLQSKLSQSEPPSTRTASLSRLFRIGRDSHGNWVVQDQEGLCGGLFVDRAEAVKFAMFENGNRPQAVIMVPGILELDMNAKPHTIHQAERRASAMLARVA